MVKKSVKMKTNEKLNIDFCGLQFNSPLVLLSGCVGFGEEYTRISGFSNRDVGAICLKGTTLEPRLGNSPHRISETYLGMLNAIGLQNPGSQVVVDEYLPNLDFSETRFIANLSGTSIEEYEKITRIFDDSPIDAMEINISCPNVKKGGLEFGNDPIMSAKVVEACRKATKKPLITKLSPNQTDIAENARCCIEAGTDGFAVINTITGMAIDIEKRKAKIKINGLDFDQIVVDQVIEGYQDGVVFSKDFKFKIGKKIHTIEQGKFSKSYEQSGIENIITQAESKKLPYVTVLYREVYEGDVEILNIDGKIVKVPIPDVTIVLFKDTPLEMHIPIEYKGKFDNWAFGCDICQDVCPWNKFSKPHNEPLFNPKSEFMEMSKNEWHEITEATFNKVFHHSALKRSGYNGLKRILNFIKSD